MESDSERYSRMLRRWADELAIPSGDFVNVDLRVAADEIDRLRARIAELEAAGNRLGDAAITGILDGNDFRARAERAEAELKEWMCCAEQRRQDRDKAEAELDISREAHRMIQSALLSQAAETEQAEAELKRVPLWIAGHGYATGHGDTVEDMLAELVADVKERAEAERMREAIRKIRAADNITAVWHIADGALASSPAGENS